MTCTNADDATRTKTTLDAGELLHYHTLYSFGIGEEHVCRLAVVRLVSICFTINRYDAHRIRDRVRTDNGVMFNRYLSLTTLTDGLLDVSELLFLTVHAVCNAHLRYLLGREIKDASGHLERIAGTYCHIIDTNESRVHRKNVAFHAQGNGKSFGRIGSVGCIVHPTGSQVSPVAVRIVAVADAHRSRHSLKLISYIERLTGYLIRSVKLHQIVATAGKFGSLGKQRSLLKAACQKHAELVCLVRKADTHAGDLLADITLGKLCRHIDGALTGYCRAISVQFSSIIFEVCELGVGC